MLSGVSGLGNCYFMQESKQMKKAGASDWFSGLLACLDRGNVVRKEDKRNTRGCSFNY